jgi:uncharacterized protein (TIGR00369 family)
MSNDLIAALQPLINKEYTDSPSPLGRWLRGVLRAAEPGSITMAYIVREEMCNPVGLLHGGIISAIIDDIIGMTVFVTTGAFYTSINLSTDFLSSARQGDVVLCTSRLLRQGTNIINAEATLTRADGKLMAHATTNLLRIDPKGS